MIWKSWEKYYDEGLLFIRVTLAFGLIYYHGWSALIGGPERWAGRGKAMSNIGIDFAPEFWGFMSALSETLFALFVGLGLFFQPALAFISFTLMMATLSHYASGRGNPGNPLTIGGVALGLIFVGPGKYSLDEMILRKRSKTEPTAETSSTEE